MSDDGSTSRDSRHQLPILLGIVGALVGFVGAVLLALPSNPQDPVTSGLIALFVFGPIGAVIGAFGGAKLGAFLRPPKPPAVACRRQAPAAEHRRPDHTQRLQGARHCGRGHRCRTRRLAFL